MSQYVSSDGLVGWKSNRLGANFYTPNVFAKEVGELSHKMLDSDSGKCKYPIDIIIISGISIRQFAEKCKAVSKFANPNTVVLVNASFGCELEEVALDVFDNNCKCVISIACDVECRQLSLGSYALVNNDNCKVYLGLTYSSQSHFDGAVLSKNEACVREELAKDSDSNTNRFLTQLTVTKWIKIQTFPNPPEMAVKIWELIIPKISLNILSVIYEQFDYETLLKNKSNEIVFKDLVKELFDICYAQCKSEVQKFMTISGSDGNHRGGKAIDYDKIVDYCKAKKKELVETTANEYPEYLSLSFESYCFYHRFEYPAHILLYQPILLAKKYDAPCSNLNFLYGFYSRLLSLSGLSIYGGRSESHMSVFDKKVAEASSTAVKSKKKSRKTKKTTKSKRNKQSKKTHGVGELVKAEKPHPLWAKCRSNNEQGLWTLASPLGNDLLLPDELTNLYLAAEGMRYPRSAGRSPYCGYNIEVPKSGESDDHYSTAESNNAAGSESDDEKPRRIGYGQATSHPHNSRNGRPSGGGGYGGYLEGSSESINYGNEGSDDDDDETDSGDEDSDEYGGSEDGSDTDSAGSSSQILVSPRGARRTIKSRSLKGPSRENSSGALENMGVIGVPHFIKRFSLKTPNNSSSSLVSSTDSKVSAHLRMDKVLKRSYTTESLELQLRTGDHLIAKDYDALHRQLSDVDVNPKQARLAHEQRRRTFANMEKELWKLQRRHNVHNRNITRPKTGPYEDLLEHMDVMRRSNANEILDFTTSRYGNAESCTIMQNDRREILSLYESKLRGKRGAKALARPQSSNAATSK